MNSLSRGHSATKFYQQDIVQKIASMDSESIGVVLRCWHDAEDVPLPNPLQDPLMRPLERGEVGVSFLSNAAEKREILSESDLRLMDRSLQPGDLVKRSIEDVQSAVVLDVRVKARLEHAISKEPIEGWKSLEDLDTDRQAEIGDYVVYEDWVGQVIELYDENIIEVPSGQIVRLPELGSRLSVGEKSENILPSPTGGVQNMLGFLFGNSRTHGPQTVISINHTVYAIAWLALNQTLDSTVAENVRRPKQFWHGRDIAKLTLVRSRLDLQMRIGERVHLQNTEGLPSTRHGREGEAGGFITVTSFNVATTQTDVDILWQDGHRETVHSVDVVPYLNPDEYDCWPGDYVYFLDDGGGKHVPAVVQTVDAIQRTASILLGLHHVEQVSLLELDPQGTFGSSSFHDGLGVRRGQTVFIHPPDKLNGLEKPRVPKIGELESWVRSDTFSQSGQLDGWRVEMASIGTDIANRRSVEKLEEGKIQTASPIGTLLWLGEVTDLHRDGTVEVLHPEGTSASYPLERLTRLYDGIEQLEDEFFEEGSEGEQHLHGMWDYDYHWDPEGKEYDLEDTENVDEIEEDPDVQMCDERDPSVSTASSSCNDSVIPESNSGPPEEASDPNDKWQKFKLLSCAPSDHAYYDTTAVQPSRHFMSRLNREYRVLANSLPENILVRAYEDRADLLRSLIIGSENTPYEDAPFVIDWHLVDYPTSPPVAHFHSLTNGNGRVNPNLYEDGKVCLSILNTWSGDKNESWDANRSSLLQALVSIQGLVLVREPWFCEPAYEKLRGTEEGIVNSRLYSEKAYVLSRGFIRRTLETPPQGLETEINWLYYSNNILEKVLADCRALISVSRQQLLVAETVDDRAIPRLSVGGQIALERIEISRLQKLFDTHCSQQ